MEHLRGLLNCKSKDFVSYSSGNQLTSSAADLEV